MQCSESNEVKQNLYSQKSPFSNFYPTKITRYGIPTQPPIHITLLTCAVSAISLEALYAGAVEAANGVSAGGILMTGV